MYNVRILNGILQKPEISKFSGTTDLGKKYPCTIAGQFDCVNHRIDDMNWIDYGECLVTAPECYGVLHASCAWDNCH